MSQLFMERFKSARLMNGYSLQDLSEHLGKKISRQALHKYEKGEVLPDSEMLEHLCEALKVRPDYFSRESIVELGEIRFRKIEKLPTKEQNCIIEQTKEILTRHIELEELLGINEKFNNPISLKSISSFEDVEKAAIEVRKMWNLGDDSISNIVELLENNNIKIIEVEADDDFDGLQTWVNNKEIPVIVLNTGKIKSKARKRFTALHELGHLLLPTTGVSDKLAETYCHYFAAAMLLPNKSIEKEIGKKRTKISINELGILKQQYGISIQAMIIRLKNLGVISESYLKYYFHYISEMGWKIEEPFEYLGVESSTRFDQLVYRALSEDIISLSKAASLKNMKIAEFRAISSRLA